jgi:cellulose synthase/poly-beta-1,6-N-acetylglucosamine synthase-like glycosyltransferase
MMLLLTSLALLVYTYVGYPMLLAVLSRVRARPVRAAAITPTLTLVVPARDEAHVLGAKLSSLLAQGWPEDRLEVLVVCDGSIDETAEVARRAGSKVTVIELAKSAGKPAALNLALMRAHGEIIVFTDARQPLEPGALRALVAPFSDPTVGATTGEIEVGAAGALGLYRRYDDWIRRNEARIGSSIGVTGALWALRRELYTPVAHDALADDLFLPMMVVAQGQRVVCTPGARALDRLPRDPRNDFRRRVRTLAGNFQLLRVAPWLLRPDRNPTFFAFCSHKVLRLGSPALLALLLLASATQRGPLPAALLAGQILLYGLALAGCASRDVHGPVAGAARAALAFVMVNVAIVTAVVSLARGRGASLWRPAQVPRARAVP